MGNAKFRETRKQIYGFWYGTIDYIQSLKNSTKTQWMKKKQWLEINSPLLFQAFLYMDNICNDSSFTGLAARPNHPRKQGQQFHDRIKCLQAKAAFNHTHMCRKWRFLLLKMFWLVYSVDKINSHFLNVQQIRQIPNNNPKYTKIWCLCIHTRKVGKVLPRSSTCFLLW